MDPLFWAVPVFFGISFVFSMLGMGGAQLYVPLLFWLGMDFKTEAVPLGMLLNVVNSASASFTYIRKKMVSWRVALPFALTMVLFAPLGVWINVSLPAKPLLAFFALFTASAALLMLSGWKPRGEGLTPKGKLVLGLSAGSGLGIAAGMIGRGGGSFVVPLLYISGLEAKAAAATSAFVVTCSGTSSFLSHIATAAHPRWAVWIGCVLAVFAGSRIGSRLMAGKLKSRGVKLVFGYVLLGVAALILVKDVFHWI